MHNAIRASHVYFSIIIHFFYFECVPLDGNYDASDVSDMFLLLSGENTLDVVHFTASSSFFFLLVIFFFQLVMRLLERVVFYTFYVL